MRLVGREILDVFCCGHADCRKWLAAWISDIGAAQWRSPQDIKLRYATASFLSANTVIFNVRGNGYRMVTRVAYRVGVVQVQWIGTHAEYDKFYG